MCIFIEIFSFFEFNLNQVMMNLPKVVLNIFFKRRKKKEKQESFIFFQGILLFIQLSKHFYLSLFFYTQISLIIV